MSLLATKTCAFCGRVEKEAIDAGAPKFSACPCRQAKYCSKKCQLAHWRDPHRSHKRECTAAKSTAKAAQPEPEVPPPPNRALGAGQLSSLRARAEGGDSKAMFQLALALHTSSGGDLNARQRAEANEWLENAAAAGNVPAQRAKAVLGLATDSGGTARGSKKGPSLHRSLESMRQVAATIPDGHPDKEHMAATIAAFEAGKELLAQSEGAEGAEESFSARQPKTGSKLGQFDALCDSEQLGHLMRGLVLGFGSWEDVSAREPPSQPETDGLLKRVFGSRYMSGLPSMCAPADEQTRAAQARLAGRELPPGWTLFCAELPAKAAAYTRLLVARSTTAVLAGESGVVRALQGDYHYMYCTVDELEVLTASTALMLLADGGSYCVAPALIATDGGHSAALQAVLSLVHSTPLLAPSCAKSDAYHAKYREDLLDADGGGAERPAADWRWPERKRKAEAPSRPSPPQFCRAYLLQMIYGPVGLLALCSREPGFALAMQACPSYLGARGRLLELYGRLHQPTAPPPADAPGVLEHAHVRRPSDAAGSSGSSGASSGAPAEREMDEMATLMLARLAGYALQAMPPTGHELQLQPGQRILFAGGRWRHGTVVRQWWRRDEWDPDRWAAYQMRDDEPDGGFVLDGVTGTEGHQGEPDVVGMTTGRKGGLTYAPVEHERCVRAMHDASAPPHLRWSAPALGARVRLHGLAAGPNAALNQKLGTVVAAVNAEGRVGVKLDGEGGRQLSVRTANLKPPADHPIYRSRPDRQNFEVGRSAEADPDLLPPSRFPRNAVVPPGTPPGLDFLKWARGTCTEEGIPPPPPIWGWSEHECRCIVPGSYHDRKGVRSGRFVP